MRARAKPRLRVLLGAAISIGPGKVDLLDAIARTGSISAAARGMGMSYRRAWTLVETMNASFRKPLVISAVGGRGGGGAQLTETGREVIRRYRAMEEKAAKSVTSELGAFARLMSDPDMRK